MQTKGLELREIERERESFPLCQPKRIKFPALSAERDYHVQDETYKLRETDTKGSARWGDTSLGGGGGGGGGERGGE